MGRADPPIFAHASISSALERRAPAGRPGCRPGCALIHLDVLFVARIAGEGRSRGAAWPWARRGSSGRGRRRGRRAAQLTAVAGPACHWGMRAHPRRLCPISCRPHPPVSRCTPPRYPTVRTRKISALLMLISETRIVRTDQHFRAAAAGLLPRGGRAIGRGRPMQGVAAAASSLSPPPNYLCVPAPAAGLRFVNGLQFRLGLRADEVP